ncbi:MAG: D-amino acid aminotransferase [Desulfobacterales bacterium]|nr:D-amino acid aminotransferase [Desulfobacterales bacterium]
MPELAYVNGRITPIEDAVVPVEDRGYQFGDAVYEVIASYGGKLFCFNEHFARLDRSMKELHFQKVPVDEIRRAAVDLFSKAKFDRAGLYIQISRGVSPRNHAFPANVPVQIVMTVRKIEEKKPSVRETGICAITVEDFRWGRCDIKTVQLLPNVLAKQKALDAGCYDAIFVSKEGIVREGSSSNLFILTGGMLKTHPLTPDILPGITRALVLDICREKKYPVEECFFDKSALYEADEVFLTGTITEVLPVIKIDGRTVGNGKVGSAAITLQEGLLGRLKSK